MKEIYYRVFKDRQNKWTAETRYSLPDSRRLDVTTAKDSKGVLATKAFVCSVNADGTVTFRIGFGDDSDYVRTVEKHYAVKRVTEKLIREAHNGAISRTLEYLLADVEDFYSRQDAA